MASDFDAIYSIFLTKWMANGWFCRTGWRVKQLSLGERVKLIISPDFAYGERGSPPMIPPNAELAFDVKLLSFQ